MIAWKLLLRNHSVEESGVRDLDDMEPDPPMSADRRSAWRPAADSNLWIGILLLVIVGAFTAARPQSFLSVQNLRNILTDASNLLILSVGMTFVIVTSGIDLSVGSVLIFASVVVARVWGAIHLGAPADMLLGLVLALLAGLFWGAINGILVAKAKVPPLIVTLGTLGMAYGAALVLSRGVDLTTVPQSLVSSIGLGQITSGVPYVAVVAIACAVGFGILLRRTRFGKWTVAVGSSDTAALRAGLPVTRHLIKVYAICGALAGLAGFLSLLRFGTTTIEGHTTDNLAAITAVVLGGTSLFGGVGSIGGTVVGVFIPTVLQNGFVVMGVQPYWQEILVGMVLIAAVYIDLSRRRRRLS
ncbi:MAG: ABC transporter permease [Acidimicrobiales bacterium]